jgi:outer membrane lipoprotein-sorting protein
MITRSLVSLILALAALEKPAGLDDALWRRLLAADEQAAHITDLTADFTQQKFTPLLKKPLVSSGHVAIKGALMRFDTTAPRCSTTAMTPRDITLYYPDDHAAEVYKLQDRLAQLAASPLPRLEQLLQHFALASRPEQQPSDDPPLLLRCTPLAEQMRKHVDHVDVDVDPRGYLHRMELVDNHGERTVMTFTHVKLNTNLVDEAVTLKLPEGTRVSRPLEGVGP